MSQNLLARHPGLDVKGDNYPAPPAKQLFASGISYLRIVLILLLLSGTYLFDTLDQPVPEWYTSAMDNRMMVIVGIFFMGNMIESSMLSSGAFEITVNGEVVWSKLETGYLPSLEHLISLVDEKLGPTSNGFSADFESLGGNF